MAYTFAAHVASLAAQLSAGTEHAPARFFALIDAAQLTSLKKPLQRLVPDAPSALLFEESFAKSALALSPVLFALSNDPERFEQQALALDAACRHLPVLSLLQTELTLDPLVEHLRSLLLIEADHTPYLLRFADSQMLAATNSILTPPQRERLFGGLSSWFTVDHESRLRDEAGGVARSGAEPASQLPLQLTAAQTHALMDAVAVPVLASQLRNLDAPFARELTHAQQTAFVCDCLAAANEAGITSESDLTAWALQRWQNEQAQHT